MLGKMVAASLTLSIGGSGGVFAPSLFTGAAGGTAFGVIARHVFGAEVGPPAIYGVIGMGAVFASAAQAPLTSIASVVEMTGNFGLTLPVMLATGIAAALSKRITYGSIYTTKLLRRGIDIERPRPTSVLQMLTVGEIMQPFAEANLTPPNGHDPDADTDDQPNWERLIGPVIAIEEPQVLFPDETLEQALRQLILYGHDGLPVIAHDGKHLEGWITRRAILRTFAERMSASREQIEQGALAAEFAVSDPEASIHEPTAPLSGYQIVEATVGRGSAADGRRLGEIEWPEGTVVVAATSGERSRTPDPELALSAGERVTLLAPRRPADRAY